MIDVLLRPFPCRLIGVATIVDEVEVLVGVLTAQGSISRSFSSLSEEFKPISSGPSLPLTLSILESPADLAIGR